MRNIVIARSYLNGLSLDEPNGLVKALALTGAVIGLWGIDNFKGCQMRRYISKRARSAAYIDFDVPKKAGGVRHISTPVLPLKQIQQALNLMLQTVCEVSPAAMGFVPGRSIVDNAAIHVGSSVIFNCDLKDFFPSITKSMVRRTLTGELASLNPSREVINLICSIVTVPRADGTEALPQGAPTSPVISNLVLKQLDHRLIRFAEKNGYRYSRYADDITFSRTGDYSPDVPIKSDAILAIIEDAGFTVNPKKTILHTHSERREVTGLTVGDKVNVSRKYVKQLRTLLHLWETRGYAEAQDIFIRDFRKGDNADLSKVVRGKINYLSMIKGKNDPACRRLRYRFRLLTKQLQAHPEEPMEIPDN